jgi:PAS domain S-box-containing protein
MAEKILRSYIILSRVEACIGGLIAVVIFALYGIKPSLLQDTGASLTAAVIGVAIVVYFLTIHQFLSRTRANLSALILSILTATNILLVIAQTGGLDSPFYSLWLLAIVATGIFGTTPILVTLGGTLSFYIYYLIADGISARYATDHLIQFGITLIAAGLAKWIQKRSGKVVAQSNKLASLSGQLSEEQLKAQVLMSSIGEGVVVINAQRQIQLFNKAAQTMTGWDESSAQTIDYNLVLKLKTAEETDLDALTDPFALAMDTKETVVNNTVVMTTQSGRKVPLSISVSPILDVSGNSNGAIALFRDITKEKELERQKDEFVSTASHEMRTPVAAIEGYISLAMNANVATIDDRAMKYLTKAHDTIGHLGELFRDLLSVTKAEENSLNAKIEAVDINKLLQAAVDDMVFTAQKKKLTVVFQLSASGGKALAPTYYVGANPERLREVVMNLIDNGIKFTPEGGITVTLDGNDKDVTVSVADTGFGIAAEDMSHLFQKFYRIDNTATRTIGGTGLGLYLCRTVIELFQGRLWVESKPGKGSTFKFTLPRLSDEQVKSLLAIAASNPIPAAPSAPAEIVQPQAGVPSSLPVPVAMPVALAAPVAMPIPGVSVVAVPTPTPVLTNSMPAVPPSS